MPERLITEAERSGLKSATRIAFQKAGGDQESLAEHTRYTQPMLSRSASASPDNADRFLPIDVAVEIDRQAGAPVIMKRMLRLLGYVPVCLPEISASHEGGAETALALKEVGEWMVAVGSALEDDGAVTTRDELDKVIAEGDEAVECLMSHLEVLKRKREKLKLGEQR